MADLITALMQRRKAKREPVEAEPEIDILTDEDEPAEWLADFQEPEADPKAKRNALLKSLFGVK